ncbi:MAG: response regulator [Bacteroidetes bacterium SW_11_45_7]|nr:MAG: response regulator [Bacteroidetes bacterium SW_11_45_7]
MSDKLTDADQKPFEILLVEDNPGDVRLTQEALKESDIPTNVNVAVDGEQAIGYLNGKSEYASSPKPDLILLDLNLPKKNGLEVLEIIKDNDGLKHIPVVIITSSEAEFDISKSYNLHANCYITKPVEFDDFNNVVQNIVRFWFSIVKLPKD